MSDNSQYISLSLEDPENYLFCTTGIQDQVNPNMYSQTIDAANLPQLPVINNNVLHDVNKDHMYGKKLLPSGFGLDSFTQQNFSSVDSSNPEIPQVLTELVIGDQPAGHFIVENQVEEDIQVHPQNFLDENFEEFGDEEPPLLINEELAGNQNNDNGSQNYTEDISDALELIRANEGEVLCEFVPLDSTKKKNPPYLVDEVVKRIISKNDEPIKFCLIGAKAYQTVQVSLRYTEEKYKNEPVHPCKNHEKDAHKKYNFGLSATKGTLDLKYHDFDDHPTVFFEIMADNFNTQEKFEFTMIFYCLNSCHSHKVNGKKMEIIFKLSESGTLIKEDHFEIRVCKNVKRDYREAIQECSQSPVPKKRLKPDQFLVKKEEHDRPSCSNVNVKVEKKPNPFEVVMLQPDTPKLMPTQKIVECTIAPERDVTPRTKFYLVQLPTLEKEKHVLDSVRLLGGRILNLESVCPVEKFGGEQQGNV